MSPKQKAKAHKRFLDFITHTTQVNSGVQQYGAGQTNKGNAASHADSDSSAVATMSNKLGNAPRRARNEPARGLLSNFSGTVGSASPPFTAEVGSRRHEVIPVTFSELVAVIPSPTSTAFTNLGQFNFQPGLSLQNGGVTPWLSATAQQFERYKVRKLQFRWVPDVSAVTNQGEAGRINLGFNYDVLTTQPPSWQAAVICNPHVNGMCFQELCLVLDPSSCTGADGKFVRIGTVANSDLKTYDAGMLFVTCDAVNNGTGPLGEIWVDYSIDLWNPKLNDMVGYMPNNAFSSFIKDTLVYGASGSDMAYTLVPDTNGFSFPSGGNANPINAVLKTGTRNAPAIELPPGQYFVTWRAYFEMSGGGYLTNVTSIPYSTTNGGVAWTAGPQNTFAVVAAAQCTGHVSQGNFMYNSLGTASGGISIVFTVYYSAGSVTVKSVVIQVSSV